MYTFSAWIDKNGANRDRYRGQRKTDAFLWDANSSVDGHNFLRVVWRWRYRPFVSVKVGRYYSGFRLGFKF